MAVKIKTGVEKESQDDTITVSEMMRCYVAVFGDSKGQTVLKDINSFIDNLIGNGGVINHRLPYHELAACAALTNLRDYINTLAKQENNPNE